MVRRIKMKQVWIVVEYVREMESVLSTLVALIPVIVKLIGVPLIFAWVSLNRKPVSLIRHF